MPDNFMSTVAGQRFCADIASIAQSLRVIAQEIKEWKKQEKQEEKKDEHR